jgi:hypothetical protein
MLRAQIAVYIYRYYTVYIVFIKERGYAKGIILINLIFKYIH